MIFENMTHPGIVVVFGDKHTTSPGRKRYGVRTGKALQFDAKYEPGVEIDGHEYVPTRDVALSNSNTVTLISLVPDHGNDFVYWFVISKNGEIKSTVKLVKE